MSLRRISLTATCVYKINTGIWCNNLAPLLTRWHPKSQKYPTVRFLSGDYIPTERERERGRVTCMPNEQDLIVTTPAMQKTTETNTTLKDHWGVGTWAIPAGQYIFNQHRPDLGDERSVPTCAFWIPDHYWEEGNMQTRVPLNYIRHRLWSTTSHSSHRQLDWNTIPELCDSIYLAFKASLHLDWDSCMHTLPSP